MTARNLGDERTSIVADGTDLIVERVFDAPRELVWTAMTSPEHVPHWWGPRGSTATVVEMDLRPGGRWRWISHAPGGGDAPFTGEYQEVAAPERYVRTVVFDVAPYNSGPGAVETVTFEELDGGRTKIVAVSRFPSAEILDYVISTGMSSGVLDSYDRFAELLATLSTAGSK